MKLFVLFLSLIPFAIVPAAETGVSVQVSQGRAVLEGRAASLDQAEREVARVGALPAVDEVVSRIEISPVGADKVLVKRALEALRNQSLIEADRVEVAVNRGKAVLTGEIGTLDENDLARELVSRVEGIREIDNRLEVMFDTIRTDAQIAAQIEFMVADDPVYEGAEISADVREGIVRLSGKIGSRELWERLVGQSYVTGVFAVEAHEVSVGRGVAAETVAALEP